MKLTAEGILNTFAKIGEANTFRELVSLDRHDTTEAVALIGGSGIVNSNSEGYGGTGGQQYDALGHSHLEDLSFQSVSQFNLSQKKTLYTCEPILGRKGVVLRMS